MTPTPTAPKMVSIPEDLFESIMHYIGEMEYESFKEESYNPDGQIEHIYLKSLTAQLYASEHMPGHSAPCIGINPDIAAELLQLQKDGYELPFAVCRKVIGQTVKFEPVSEVAGETILFGVMAEHFDGLTV